MKKALLVENVTIGADPELFLYSTIEDKYISVCGLVGGTKEEPLPITDEGHALQEDGCAIEFCIPPCKTTDDFVENIEFVKSYIDNTVLTPLQLVSRAIPSARFELDQLKNPRANLSGCDPDYNAYTFEENEVINEDVRQKAAGGHIHIGYEKPNVDLNIKIIKAMDLFVGVPSILLDSDRLRKRLYGKAGCHRHKKYGPEYRTPSNFWLQSKELTEWIAQQTFKAIEFVNEMGIITNEPDIIKCINEGDIKLAIEILDDYKIEIPQGLLINI